MINIIYALAIIGVWAIVYAIYCLLKFTIIMRVRERKGRK